jgi:hypothetical protein
MPLKYLKRPLKYLKRFRFSIVLRRFSKFLKINYYLVVFDGHE